MHKKRHHYVPKCYLKFFCDERGQVVVYLKDTPKKLIHRSPNNTGFHKYYYSQPLLEGGNDHNALENLFSSFEEKWPPIVKRLLLQADVNDVIEDIFPFIALQRARVPASRDTSEAMLAEMVKSNLRSLDASGDLPPKPGGFEDILDHVEISIDPHQSIHSMVDVIREVEEVLNQIGVGALHNVTEIPFLTSDNPVIWFDPSIDEAAMQPYHLQFGGPVVMLFPVTPNLMIYGHSSMRERFKYDGFGYSELSDRGAVEMMNRQICRFAYKAVYAQKIGQEAIINEHAHVSPILQKKTMPSEAGETTLYNYAFGKPPSKPKWKG